MRIRLGKIWITFGDFVNCSTNKKSVMLPLQSVYEMSKKSKENQSKVSFKICVFLDISNINKPNLKKNTYDSCSKGADT